MNMIFTEVIESMKRTKLASMLIFFQISILFFAVTVLFLNYAHINTKSNKAESLRTLNSYQLSDTLLNGDELKSRMNQPDFLMRMKTFYSHLESTLSEKYIYIFQQPAALLNFEGPNKMKFFYGYEEGVRKKSYNINKEGPYYSVKALQMNKQALGSFAVQTIEGENLSPEDFENNNNSNVPVLLGSEYRSFYKIGDTLKANYLQKDFNFYVKGFIKPNTLVFNPNNPELYLDRYIIMPAQQFSAAPSKKEEFSFQQKHYLQLINGSIFSSANEYIIRSKLENIKNSSEFYDTHLIGASNLPLNLIFSTIQENVFLLSLISVSIFIVCVISISILMVTKLEANMKNMSIHLISGATMNHLFSYFLAEIICMVCLPGLLIVVLYKVFIGSALIKYLAVIISIVSIISLLTIIPLKNRIKNLQISMFLKRSE